MRKIKTLLDANLFWILTAYYTVYELLVVVRISYSRSLAPPSVELRPFSDLLFNALLIDWIVVIIFMSFIAITTKFFIQRKYSWPKIIAFHLLLSLLIGFVIRFIAEFYRIYKGVIVWETYEFWDEMSDFIFVIDANYLIYFGMIAIIYSYNYLKEVKEAEIKRQLAENQLVETKLKLLTSKLQPHFLFNTLNTISSLVKIDKDKAQDTIVELSEFLREVLYTDATMIKLRKELQILNKYLDLLQTRFGDHFQISKDIETSCLKYLVPPMLIQPIIENTIKHGYSPEHSKIKVEMTIKCLEENIHITIWNNGKLLSQNPLNGVGITSIQQRLAVLFNEDYSLVVQNVSNRPGVETTIIFPAKETL